MTPLEALTAEWRVRVNRMKNAHYRAATLFERIHLYLGVPVIVLSSIVGTAVFASLQTFLRYSERADKHRIAGAKYGALNVDLELLESLSSPGLRFIRPRNRRMLAAVIGFNRIPSGVACTTAFVPSSMWNCRRSHAGITT